MAIEKALEPVEENRTPFAAAFVAAFGDEDEGAAITEHYICEALCKAGDWTTLGMFLRALGYSESEILERVRAWHANKDFGSVEPFLNAVLCANVDVDVKAVVSATKAVLAATRESVPF